VAVNPLALAKADDAAYFRRRAGEELEAADRATHETAAAAHEHMARRYAAALDELRRGQPDPCVAQVNG